MATPASAAEADDPEASSGSDSLASSSSEEDDEGKGEEESDPFAFPLKPPGKRKKRATLGEAAKKKKKKQKEKQQQHQEEKRPQQPRSNTRARARSGAGARAAGAAEEHGPTYVYGDDPEDFVAPGANKSLPPLLVEEELEDARWDDEEKVAEAAQNPATMRGKDVDFFRVPVHTKDIARFSVFYELSGQRGQLGRCNDLTRGAGVQVLFYFVGAWLSSVSLALFAGRAFYGSPLHSDACR